ncbi:transcription-repair coupling factor [Microvirga subterranea]|uniref:Transcription-repair-coupling factor n=1 Tax=Microvirga subterranea TaxID=186651 RepID=A0A370HTU4_9HYPH|nr:transcription-repair coupling factor [Microvirga subterranea]RDI61938.1 transcription-repair coupling factor (superfamily II helicase) [Microvirga subterranea]
MAPRTRRQQEPEAHPSHTIRTAGRLGESALAILRKARETRSGVLVVTANERRANALVRILGDFAPDLGVLLLPGWDCLPYDRASPSRRVMGRRLAVLRALASGEHPCPIVVTTAAGLLQRVPPKDGLARAELVLKPGDVFERERLERQLRRMGYVFDERVDEPGEAALRGQVIDLYPAGTERPVRVEHDDGRIVALRPFDPASQLADGECADLRLLPASEHFSPDDGEPAPRAPGSEHRLPDHFDALDSLPALMARSAVLLDAGAEARMATSWEQIRDAHESRTRLRPERAEGERPLAPDRLYLTQAEWADHLGAVDVTRIEAHPDDPELAPPPVFATGTRPFRRFADYVAEETSRGFRVVLAGAGPADLRPLLRALDEEAAPPVETVSDWSRVEAADRGCVLALETALDRGFRDIDARITVIAAADVLGSRARTATGATARPVDLAGTELEFRVGDVVIHQDHGLGVLLGIETVETDGATTDLLRLSYAEDATLMVPVDEMDRIWRYGASADAVGLDRLDGEAWEKRRAKVEAEVAESAVCLVETVRAREVAEAPKLVPPRAAYERFAARFPFTETPDQASAIAAVLADLASGRPMNRLVCGDVGFGKTEVALRAAAAAALSGGQVAVVAPTTVLVRQHVQTFERRFEGLGIKVGHLSRLVSPAEAKAVKAGLADGSIRVVIGTHALAGRGVRFADLGLVVIDEEQRFGAAHKAKLRSLAEEAHVLTLTATPIPRTLQAALVGLQDLSVIATPPSQRQPIRTFTIPFDDATVREALMREKARGGQSFFVCPRIEDIAPMAERLKELVPELETVVIHGAMPADAIDKAMVGFADGQGDVLLATNIIESGLDVPGANTMLIWRPDRFGLAQLHQLRGRVGRGRIRGIAYLLTDPAHKLARGTRKRLETLESLDRLGAGFAISARDLDQRGAGDLFGEEQAGHMKLIGVSLYQHLLTRALAAARGEAQAEQAPPEINIDAPGHIPADYVPEPEVRINLYARLARLEDEEEVDAIEEEIRNRFGPPPPPVDRLVALARLREQCRAQAVARIDAGPQAIALSFTGEADRSSVERAVARSDGALEWRKDRLVWSKTSGSPEERLEQASKLLRFLAKAERPR